MKYTKKQLISICEDAIVQQEKWADRDSFSSQLQLGQALVLLKAECKFEIITRENADSYSTCYSDEDTIWIKFWAKNFKWFDILDGDTEEYPNGLSCFDNGDDLMFYLPTRKRLEKKKGKDWY